MWHAITPVLQGYDPILYESPDPSKIVILNAGPGNVKVKSWLQVETYEFQPQIEIQLRPGDQRIISGSLVRANLTLGNFAAIAWTIIF